MALFEQRCQGPTEQKSFFAKSASSVSGEEKCHIILVDKWVHSGDAGRQVVTRHGGCNSSLQKESGEADIGDAAAEIGDSDFDMARTGWIINNRQ